MDVERMKIPVFVSCPTDLSPAQDAAAQIILDMLDKNRLAWRALGRSDYSYRLPLTEVLGMIRHCSGGVILGFRQAEARSVTFKGGTPNESKVDGPVYLPTPWNHLEAGIMFNQKFPILIFKEKGIEGGVFDIGTPDVFIQRMPVPPLSAAAMNDLETLFQNWSSDVKSKYYER